MKSLTRLTVLIALAIPHVAGFGLTVSGSSWTIDTEGGLVFTINSANADVTSMKFNGIETQDSSKMSGISSGLGSASCKNERLGNNNNYIKITCVAGTLTQYYVAQYKTPAIHMATYTTAEPSIGELRFIARLKRSAVSSGVAVSDIKGGTAIEASDVFSVNGQTRSKFFSGKQFINDQVHGVTGSGVGVYMIIPGTGYEGSSGGPFFKDINNQGGDVQELYFYMNSGHTQTEAFRQGLHGPYALWFTTGAAPSASYSLDFWNEIGGISGYVPVSGRGQIKGKAIDIPSAYASDAVVGWSNTNAQYWAKVGSDSNFNSPLMKPGTYTQTLYKGELAVGTQSVIVSVGTAVTSNIYDTQSLDTTAFLWKIGEFDGRPTGFLNSDLIQTMHPSDSRMKSWGPITYTVGNSISGFPMAAFKAIGPVTVKFNLASNQLGARTLVIGTSLAFAGGRPGVQVNNWTGANPPAPNQPDSRGVTRGVYRGNNIAYTYIIPSGTLVSGTNTLTINVISGSSGDMFLSPNIVFDAVALY